MFDDLGEISVVNAGGSEMADIRVTALVGAGVWAGGLLGRFPDVPIEVARATCGRWGS